MGGTLVLVFFRQLYYTGVQSAGIVMLLAALAGGGFVLTLQASLPIGLETVLELLASLMAKVLGVVFTLLVMAARSVSAISTELAMAQVSGERTTLDRLGVNSRLYLVLPRVLAPAVSGAVLYLYFVFTALLVGALVSNQTFDVWELMQIFRALDPAQILLGMVRTGLFAALSLVYVLRFAIRQARRLPDIPLAASNGVFQAIVVMLMLELTYQLLRSLISSAAQLAS